MDQKAGMTIFGRTTDLLSWDLTASSHEQLKFCAKLEHFTVLVSSIINMAMDGTFRDRRGVMTLSKDNGYESQERASFHLILDFNHGHDLCSPTSFIACREFSPHTRGRIWYFNDKVSFLWNEVQNLQSKTIFTTRHDFSSQNRVQGERNAEFQ